MMHITSPRQAVRIAELLTEIGSAVCFELANDLQTEPDNVHVAVFCIDGVVRHYFVEAEGDAPIIGTPTTWKVPPDLS